METSINNRLQQIFDFANSYKTAIIGLICFILCSLFIFLLTFSTNSTDLFYTGNQKSLSKVTKILQEKKIAFDLKNEGIFLKKSDVPYASLEVFGQDHSVGLEIFDFRASMMNGDNPFTQNIQYIRALQGELERSVKSLSAVADCRIHINLPKNNLLQKNIDLPSAAVILKLNTKLNYKQIHGIQRLISSSIQGLLPENVVVTDSNGNLLSKGSLDSDNSEYQNKLTADVLSLILPIAGTENVRVAIQVFYNHNTKFEELESYSKDPVIKSQHTYAQKSSELAPNTDVATDIDSGQVNSNTEETKTEYAISCLRRRSNYNPGDIERISVAIVLNDSLQIATDDIEKLVRSYIGFNEERGDQISIISMKFLEQENSDLIVFDSEDVMVSILLIIGGIIFLILVLGIIMYLMFKSEPKKKFIAAETQALTDNSNLNDLVKKVIHESPRQAKQLVRFWLSLDK